MPPPKGRGPSCFTEWMIGTTLANACPPPKKEPPKSRDVFRVEVTTDDESEEDTIKITYPRTGRSSRKKRPEPKPVKTIESAVKQVRFEDGTSPIKSALKKTRITTFESEEELSDTEAISSAEIITEVESSDEPIKPVKCKKKIAKPVDTDSDSECEADPHPTCTCVRCFRGRESIGRQYLKASKKRHVEIKPDTDTSESEVEAPPKNKNQQAKSKKKQDTTTEVETSDSEVEVPVKTKHQNKNQNKAQNSNKAKAKKPSKDSDAEASESEAEIPPKAQRKKGEKKLIEPDTDGETSESAKESDAEPVKPQKKGNNSKAQVNKKNAQIKAQKGSKQSKKQIVQSDSDEASSEEEVPKPKKNKKGKQKQRRDESEPEAEAEHPKKSRYANVKDLEKKLSEPEGNPGAHYRRPHFIEPVRAEVHQTERVIESPNDPPPNSYYDSQHNVLRVYHGPMYGSHHGQALYPDRNAPFYPPHMGMPHPSNNPYWYGNHQDQPPQGGYNNYQAQYPGYSGHPQGQQPGFNNSPNQKGESSQRPHPSGAYDFVMPGQGYSHVPVTQGMPPPGMAPQGPWTANAYQDPAWIPGHYSAPGMVQPPNRWDQGGKNEKEVVRPSGQGPPSSKDRNKDGENNVVPNSMKDSNGNPYVPKRSQFSIWEIGGRTDARKVSDDSRKGSKAGTNQINNDGGNDWNQNQPVDNTWGNTQDQQGSNRQHSGGSNNTTRRNQGNNSNGWGQNGEGSRRNYSNHTNNNNNGWGTNGNNNGGGGWGNNNPNNWGGNNSNGWGGNENGSRKSGQGGSNANNNVVPTMPGTWVDTPTAGPSWGDPTAAADTGGQSANW